MSDLLIKGVKMPKTCNECQSTLGLFCNECPLFKDFPKEFTGKSKLLQYTRLFNCPLVEIPSHGRLIDADKLENIFWDILSKPNEYDKPLHDMMLELQVAPTVIESEEK